jgi:hypothetical protein
VDKFTEAYQKYKDEKEKEKKEKKRRKKEKEDKARKDKKVGIGNPFEGSKPKRAEVAEDDDDDKSDDEGGDTAKTATKPRASGSAGKLNPFASSPKRDSGGETSPQPQGEVKGKKNPFARTSSSTDVVISPPAVTVVDEEDEEEESVDDAPPVAPVEVPAPAPVRPPSPKPARPPPPSTDVAPAEPKKKANPFAKKVEAPVAATESPDSVGAAAAAAAAAAAPAPARPAAAAAPRTFDAPPTRGGYLDKQGKDKWSKRWCELDDTGSLRLRRR